MPLIRKNILFQILQQYAWDAERAKFRGNPCASDERLGLKEWPGL